MLNWLGLAVKALHQITEDRQAAELLGLKGYDHYITTSEWRKVSQVIREYYQKYTAFVSERRPLLQFHADSLEELYEVQLPLFGKAIAEIELDVGDEQQPIAVDYLVSLVQLGTLLKEYPLATLSEHLRLELLMEVSPTPLAASDL